MFRVIKIASFLTIIHVFLCMSFSNLFTNIPIIVTIRDYIKEIPLFPIRMAINHSEIISPDILISNTLGLNLSFYGYAVAFAFTFLFYICILTVLIFFKYIIDSVRYK